MRNVKLIGCLLVIVGSFLPLVHLPIIGTWNYWKIDHNLAIICWVFSSFAMVGILANKDKLVKFSAILLIILFAFTIFAIKMKTMNFFSFLPFHLLKEVATATIKLNWAWLLEFSGATLMLLVKNKN